MSALLRVSRHMLTSSFLQGAVAPAALRAHSTAQQRCGCRRCAAPVHPTLTPHATHSQQPGTPAPPSRPRLRLCPRATSLTSSHKKWVRARSRPGLGVGARLAVLRTPAVALHCSRRPRPAGQELRRGGGERHPGAGHLRGGQGQQGAAHRVRLPSAGCSPGLCVSHVTPEQRRLEADRPFWSVGDV